MMDRTSAALVAGLAYAMTWGIGGGLFGAVVRWLGRRRSRGTTVSPGGTISRALFSGARFGAVLGFFCGVFIVYLMDTRADFVRDLVGSSVLLGVIAVVAIVFGFIAYGLESIGVSKRSENSPGKDDSTAE